MVGLTATERGRRWGGARRPQVAGGTGGTITAEGKHGHNGREGNFTVEWCGYDGREGNHGKTEGNIRAERRNSTEEYMVTAEGTGTGHGGGKQSGGRGPLGRSGEGKEGNVTARGKETEGMSRRKGKGTLNGRL